MNKILTTIAVAMSAFALNAATVTWSFAGTATTLPNGDPANAVVAYLFSSDIGASAVETALKAGTWNPTAISSYVATATTTAAGAVTKMGNGSFQNETVNFSMVILDAANIASATAFKYAEVNNVAFVTQNKVANFTTSLTSATWTSVVPEPTSGLLMLLGMGALALRRRRA